MDKDQALEAFNEKARYWFVRVRLRIMSSDAGVQNLHFLWFGGGSVG